MVKGEDPVVSMLFEKRYRVGEVTINYTRWVQIPLPAHAIV